MNNPFNFTDINNSNNTNKYEPIPEKTLAKVRLNIKSGGYNDKSQGWDNDMATKSATGSVFLKCEYTILSGKYKDRKIWSLIGLHSPKGPAWKDMGKKYVLSVIESSRGIYPKDKSDSANQKRVITSLKELDDLVFIAEIGVGKDAHGEPKNEIKKAIAVDHPEYPTLMTNDQFENKLPF